MRFSRRSETPEEALAALADGSLAGDRRAALEARVAGTPELAGLLAEQERAVALVRGAADEVAAPASLRARVEAERRRKVPRARSRPFAFAGGIAVAAAVVLVLALTLPGGAGGPSVAEAAALTTRPATDPAPAVSPTAPKLLQKAVGDVPFPNWLEKFGWRATGVRTDTVGGRDATTVFYEKEGKRIGYTIVAGDPLDVPEGATPARREGVDLAALELDGREVVTWERGGFTCILSGDLVDRETLVKLAAWRGQGDVPF
jgi:anti-sigma factor RsiW